MPKLSEDTIRQHTIAQSFDRGQSYYRAGSVHSLVQRGDRLQARVEGSEANDYRVDIGFDQSGITHATCSCPYDYEGWCKHIVATLLTCLHQPEQIEQRPDFAEVLAPLSREQLQTIVQNLADEQPEWMDAVELQIALLTQPKAKPSQKAPRRTSVDPKPIERQVQRIIDRYSEGWNDEPALDEIRDIIQKADAFLEQGDGHNALIILGAVIRAYVEVWMNLDGSSGESGAFFEELDDALTEAILSAELSNQELQQWQEELQTWQEEVDGYGVEGFEMSLTALEQGWDYPPLQEVLQGEIGEWGAWEGEAPPFADDLARIRLKILERQQRYQEYVYLAEAEGQTDRYLQMLAKLGRSQEAIALAEQEMSTVNEARPEWVIENARDRAEAIMDAGQAQYYDQAIDWLRRVRAIYLQLGQRKEWKRYHTELLQTHARKRKLIALLQQRDLT